jgi:putative protease
VGGKVGEPLWLELDDGEGHVVRRTTEVLLEEARKRPLDAAYLEAQLGRLGGTPLFLAGLEVHLEGAVIVPVSALNQVRREASEELLRLRAQPPRWTLVPEASVVRERLTPSPIDVKPELVVLVRTVEQLEVAARHGVQTLYLELEHLKQYPQAIARWRELAPSREIWAAPPRVTKAGEDWILRQIEAGGADGILARGWDHLQWFAGRTRLRGDFSLNVANPLTAQWFLERFNLEGVTISCDLAAEQVIDLANASDPSRLELILHQHMPMFHMEHCVFCAFLSTGKDFRDCGRPCEKHEVRLVDHTGASHPVKADAGCRNTVFNARAQTGAEYADAFLAAGLRRFRIEFLDESPADVAQSLDRYRRLLDGRLDGQGLWRELKAVNQLGVTRGTLKTSALSR